MSETPKEKPKRKVEIILEDIVTEDGIAGVDIHMSPTPEEIMRDLMDNEPTAALDYGLVAINAIRKRNQELNNVKPTTATKLTVVPNDQDKT